MSPRSFLEDVIYSKICVFTTQLEFGLLVARFKSTAERRKYAARKTQFASGGPRASKDLTRSESPSKFLASVHGLVWNAHAQSLVARKSPTKFNFGLLLESSRQCSESKNYCAFTCTARCGGG